MDHDFFVKRAIERQCFCPRAAERIKSHAIKKDNDQENRADANLLPTVNTLRRVRLGQHGSTACDEVTNNDKDKDSSDAPKGAFSVEEITGLLRCECQDVCRPRTIKVPLKEDVRLARRVIGDDDLLRLFAVLCLSGCLFAMRSLVDNGIRSPEASVAILDSGKHGMREALFQAFATPDQQCPHREPHGAQFMLCLGHVFCDSLRHKGWLLRIPTFGRSTQPHPFELMQNMPFYDESEPREPRDDRRFFKCKIAHGHCSEDSRELLVRTAQVVIVYG